MRKKIVLQRITPYEGVVLGEVHHVSGLYRFVYDGDRPPKTVLVAKQGTRFYDLGLEKDMELRWARFFRVRLPDYWEGSHEEYLYEKDLPVFCGRALKGMAVEFRTARTGKEVLVVSEKAWTCRWEEVKSLLLKEGYAIPEEKLGELDLNLTLGGDPEFEVFKDGVLVPACTVPIFRRGAFSGPIGLDGAEHIAELRPDPACSEEEYAENFLALAKRVKEEGVLLSVQGDYYPLGGHIHVGSSNPFVARALKEGASSFIEALDDFVGRVLLPTSGEARGEYKNLGAYEFKEYGWEYRTPPASFYADPEVVRIVYKLTRNLVEVLLREGELSYEVLEDGRAKKEEYYRFLTKEETEYFLSFPLKWARREIVPFVPVGELPAVILSFSGGWLEDMMRVFKEVLINLPVKRPVRLVLYGIGRLSGDAFAIPTAPEKWRLKGEFPKAPFINGALPEVWVGVPYRFRILEVLPSEILKEFTSWVREYLAQLDLLAAPVAAE
ncbi:MAG: putative amidoligase domain-containing protein [Pyrobaculum sp.]|jgi:hypothetical protein